MSQGMARSMLAVRTFASVRAMLVFFRNVLVFRPKKHAEESTSL